MSGDYIQVVADATKSVADATAEMARNTRGLAKFFSPVAEDLRDILGDL